MSNCFNSVSFGSASSGVRPLILGVLSCLLAFAGTSLNAQITVPADLNSSLGWKALVGKADERIDGSSFMVRTQPALWPKAKDATEAWLNATPAVDVNSAEGVFRRIARVQALTLSATTPEVLATLRAERVKLGEIATKLEADARANTRKWQLESAARDLRRLQEVLGNWLVDSKEDRVQLFREQLIAAKPISRAELAARFGGEAKFAPMLAQLTKQMSLEQRVHDAEADSETDEPARTEAIKKARAAETFFNTFYRFTDEYETFRFDRDVRTFVDPGSGANSSLTVPDLVKWIGEERATPLVLEAFALPVKVSPPSDSLTEKLAVRLLLEGKLQPARVPWSLFGWPNQKVTRKAAADNVAIYDAVKVKFPNIGLTEKKSDDWGVDDTLVIIAASLALTDREAEGIALLKPQGLVADGLPYHVQITAATAGAIWDFFARIAGEDVKPKAWGILAGFALKADRTDALIALGKAQLAKASAGSPAAARWQAALGWAYVSADKPEEGIPFLVTALDAERALPEPAVKAKTHSFGGDDSSISGLQINLLELAEVLKKTEIAQKLLTSMTADFSKPENQAWDTDSLFAAYSKAMIARGEHAKLVELLRARLAEVTKPKPKKTGRDEYDYESYSSGNSSSQIETINRQLIDVLNRQGHHAEVVAVLSESPDWHNKDLKNILGERGLDYAHPLAVSAAGSLSEVGRREDAVRILEAYITANPGSDPAYGLLTKIEGAKVLPFLDEMTVDNRFEERPLIWKASVQLAAGNVAEAEATVKKAIAIDPSDGEQPKGDRMRAYSVLREVALKKGDTQQAEFLAGVVSAIRQSEGADDLASVGLKSRAIEAYQKALTAFADAYCIQSRLARQLAAENRIPEAMEHYRRAFELMPDSFGRVESHCFGCEQAFAGEEAQSIAEKVFLDLASKPTVKPQVYYLLGYLRMEQERWDEAADYYTKAVTADPDYLNAWSKLSDSLSKTDRPREEKDRATFRLLELSGNHNYADIEEVRDFPKLWAAFEQKAKKAPAVLLTLFPLGDKAPGVKKPGVSNQAGLYPGLDNLSDMGSPAERLRNHQVMSAVTEALGGAYRWSQSKE